MVFGFPLLNFPFFPHQISSIPPFPFSVLFSMLYFSILGGTCVSLLSILLMYSYSPLILTPLTLCSLPSHFTPHPGCPIFPSQYNLCPDPTVGKDSGLARATIGLAAVRHWGFDTAANSHSPPIPRNNTATPLPPQRVTFRFLQEQMGKSLVDPPSPSHSFIHSFIKVVLCEPLHCLSHKVFNAHN